MERIPELRRSIVVILLGGAITYTLVRAAETTNWPDWELVAVVLAGIGLDGVNRTIEKIRGAAAHASRLIQGDRPDQGA